MRYAFRHAHGFSLLELLIVIAILGIVATIALPQFGGLLDRGRQRTTMTDMRSISTALGLYEAESGAYPTTLLELEPEYMQRVPRQDPWGVAYEYSLSGRDYTLTSLGADGTPGPSPPSGWADDPYEPDLVLVNGVFIQAPGRE